jgi:hypothetical protein
MFVFIGLIAVLIYGGITYAIFWVVRRIGFPQVAKGIAFVSLAALVYLLLMTLFEDQLFSKSNARNLLKEQEIILGEDFEIVENKSMSAVGDYYHTFTLIISSFDKERIDRDIRVAATKDTLGQSADITQLTDRYHGKRLSSNYETETEFVRKLYERNGKGYAPTYRIVRISKNDNTLVFEDIDD